MDTTFALDYLFSSVGRAHVVNDRTVSTYVDMKSEFDAEAFNTALSIDEPRLSFTTFDLFCWDRVNGYFVLRSKENDPIQLALTIHEILEFGYNTMNRIEEINFFSLFHPKMFPCVIQRDEKSYLDEFWYQACSLHVKALVQFTYKGLDMEIRTGFPMWISTEETNSKISKRAQNGTITLDIHRIQWMGEHACPLSSEKMIMTREVKLTDAVWSAKYRIAFPHMTMKGLKFEKYEDQWDCFPIIGSYKFGELVKMLWQIEGKLPDRLPTFKEMLEKVEMVKINPDKRPLSAFEEDLMAVFTHIVYTKHHSHVKNTHAKAERLWDSFANNNSMVQFLTAALGE